jgi:hypothetical protein
LAGRGLVLAAATFMPSAPAADLSHTMSISTLSAVAIDVATLIVQGLAVLTSFVDRRMGKPQLLRVYFVLSVRSNLRLRR